MNKILYRARKESGHTQVSIADEFGVTQATWSRWETGASNGMPVKKIADFFGISAHSLSPETH